MGIKFQFSSLNANNGNFWLIRHNGMEASNQNLKGTLNDHLSHIAASVIINCIYRSGTVNSNTITSKFHLIRTCFEIFARFLSFHVQNAWLIQTWLIRSSINSK